MRVLFGHPESPSAYLKRLPEWWHWVVYLVMAMRVKGHLPDLDWLRRIAFEPPTYH